MTFKILKEKDTDRIVIVWRYGHLFIDRGITVGFNVEETYTKDVPELIGILYGVK